MAGEYFAMIDGELLSLRDLLERERGREVSDNEAWNYCLRYRKLPSQKERINSLLTYIKRKHDQKAITG